MVPNCRCSTVPSKMPETYAVWSQTIIGEVASKANSRKLVTMPRSGRPLFIKSDKARRFERDLKRQVQPLPDLMTGRLVVHCDIYYASNRPDLDESIVLDGLQGLIYKNDRQVREKHIFHHIDRLNPRVMVRVVALEPQQKSLEI